MLSRGGGNVKSADPEQEQFRREREREKSNGKIIIITKKKESPEGKT